jgi:hypothetical protein
LSLPNQKARRWPLWGTALSGLGAGVLYGAVQYLLGNAPEPPPDLPEDANLEFVLVQWFGAGVVFAVFFLIVGIARNFVVSRGQK